MSELTQVIDGLTGELERFREMHAETLIAHTDICNRLATRIRDLEAELSLERRAQRENRSPVALAIELGLTPSQMCYRKPDECEKNEGYGCDCSPASGKCDCRDAFGRHLPECPKFSGRAGPKI